MLNTNHTICDQKTVNLYNQSYSQKYRDYDNEFIHSNDYAHFVPILTDITTNLNRPIKVLEIGCGTGRYFHLLKNTIELTGIDISKHMLELAKDPIKAEEVNIPNINLIEGSVFEQDFGSKKFDFIYSIGVLGEHAPFTQDMCAKLYDLLEDGGTTYFTIVDIDDRKNFKRKIADAAYPLLPASIKSVLDKRWETNYMTYKELDNMMQNSPFEEYNIKSYKAGNGGWTGAHFEVFANKDDVTSKPLFV